MNYRKYLIQSIRFVYVIIYLGPLRNILINRQIQNNKNIFTCSDYKDFKFIEPIDIVDKIKINGFCVAGSINNNIINNIKNYCTENTIINPHLTNNIIYEITHSEKIHQVVKMYFGTEPILFSTMLNKRQDEISIGAESCNRDFHFDVGDYKAITVFLYLTDVDMHSSPHVVIKSTHTISWYKKMFKRFLTVKEAKKIYNDDISYIYANAGSIIFEDLSCYHKRAYGNNERIMLSATYHIKRKQSKTLDYIKQVVL